MVFYGCLLAWRSVHDFFFVSPIGVRSRDNIIYMIKSYAGNLCVLCIRTDLSPQVYCISQLQIRLDFDEIFLVLADQFHPKQERTLTTAEATE
jgi:hypothetical protein